MSSLPGYFPIQCDCCGRELINMGCSKCFPQERLTPPPGVQPTAGSPTKNSRLEARIAQSRNSRGFPKFSQLSLVTSPINVPASPSRPRSPRKKAATFMPPTPVHEVQFRGVDGRPLKLSDGTSVAGPPMVNGHHKPFMKRVRQDETFTVSTKFEWGPHRWETCDIPCHRDTTETALFNCLCIHFPRFVMATKECSNSEECLCGGSKSSVSQEDVRILGYDLFDMGESFTIVVKAGINL